MRIAHTRCFRFSPQYSPSHGTNARSPLAVPQGEVPEERGLRQLRYSVARKRGSARRNPSSCPHLDIRSLSFYADLGNPKTTLRIATDISEPRICPFLILAVFGFPLNTPLPTGQALAHRSRSRKGKFPKIAVSGNFAIQSRVNAVPRDAIRKIVRASTFGLCLFMRIHGNPKTTHRIATGASDLPMRPFLILAIFGFRRVAAFDVEILSSMFLYQAKNVPRRVHETSRKNSDGILPLDVFCTQQF